ncbi:MAG TPA: 3-methyl-2-oxobutanoate hydroxymethyltransferase [Nannocystis sp.]
MSTSPNHRGPGEIPGAAAATAVQVAAAPAPQPRRITVPQLGRFKRDGQAITMVTAYDATFARLVDEAGVDVILVGDSLGMVMQGHPHTLEVTLEHMAYHARCVRRAVARAHLVVDMPFMSYQVSPEQALVSAGRLVQEGGAEAVKLEGGARCVDAVRKIVSAGIPVMGHVGLTPQSVHEFGGFRVQARGQDAAERLRQDSLALQEAGAYALVLEGIPAALARQVSESLAIPTIGIGAGAGCDGQVLVMQDLLGLDDRFKPKFVKRYAELAGLVREAFSEFARDVRERRFPGDEHSFAGEARVEPVVEPGSGAYGPT